MCGQDPYRRAFIGGSDARIIMGNDMLPLTNLETMRGGLCH